MTTLEILKIHKKETQRELRAIRQEITKKYPELEKVINPPELAYLLRLYEKKEELNKLISRESVKNSRDKKKNREHQANFRKRAKLANGKARFVKLDFPALKTHKPDFSKTAKSLSVLLTKN